MSDTATNPDKETKPVSPEVKAARAATRKVTRRLARALFGQAWGADNPSSSKTERNAAFKENETEYLEKARKLRKRMKKAGVELSLAAKVEKATDAA